MKDRLRSPIVAGSFYPGDADTLSATVQSLLGVATDVPQKPLEQSIGLIVPHAGYAYSGHVAAAGFRAVASCGTPEVVIALGANHTGTGAAVSLAEPGHWRTPLGDVPIDSGILEALTASGLPIDAAAFAREHSIEVQLPFLQTLWADSLRVVPVCVQSAPFTALEAAADVIAGAMAARPVLVLASTDFTHYEPDAVARELDALALERILSLDAAGFYQLCVRRKLSICGSGAVALLILLAHRLGWTHTDLSAYATSGDVTGDRSAVVGYAAITAMGGNDG